MINIKAEFGHQKIENTTKFNELSFPHTRKRRANKLGELFS